MTKVFPSFLSPTAHLAGHRAGSQSKAQQDESTALMSHAQSLLTGPR